MEIEFSAEDKRVLCSVAREAIVSRLHYRSPRYPELTKGCLQKGGVFVTLHENGHLRGCIGRMQSTMPLAETIKDMAVAAAFEDPRFDALHRSEIDAIDIEITILGPLQRIRGKEDVVVGNHGLYIIAQRRAGVLLPQVATEYGWDSATFLDNVCLKAGLPAATWKDPESELFVFEGLVFGENG